MRARSLVALAMVLGLGRIGHTDPKGDVQSKLKQAMESYDSMDYDAARKTLNQALATAKKAKLDRDPVTARAYLDLGIVAFNMPDLDTAKMSFLSAVQIDPKIQIDAAYKTPEMAKLLDQARSEAGGGGGGGGGAASEPSLDLGAADNTDCKAVKGLVHSPIETAKGGAPLPIEALVAPGVKPVKVSVMYRQPHSVDYIEIKMTKQGDCKYTATIPAGAMHGDMLHYYVAAYNDAGKPIAAKGAAGSPNIMDIEGGGAARTAKAGDDEDPLNGGKKAAAPKQTADVTSSSSSSSSSSETDVTSSVQVGSKHQKIMVAVSGGTGFGYVTGTTEAANMVKSCCIGNSLVIIAPEIAYMVSPQTSIGVVGRIGFPVGANIDGHATLAPAGMLRLRYALAADGEGVHVMGQLGAGIIRNTIKIQNPMTSSTGAVEDTDIVAQGPLLLGGGVGFTKHLSGNIAFLADLSAIAGIAVVNHFGSAPALNSGVTADLSLGLAVGF